MRIKLVYKDNETVKVLWGRIEAEDNTFLSFIAEDGTLFRINKSVIISIKTLGTFSNHSPQRHRKKGVENGS